MSKMFASRSEELKNYSKEQLENLENKGRIFTKEELKELFKHPKFTGRGTIRNTEIENIKNVKLQFNKYSNPLTIKITYTEK